MIENPMIGSAQSAFLGLCEAEFASVPEEKREHFLYVVRALMDCYKSEQNQAIVLITEGLVGASHKISLIAINADQSETEELIDTLSIYRQINSTNGDGMMN